MPFTNVPAPHTSCFFVFVFVVFLPFYLSISHFFALLSHCDTNIQPLNHQA